MQREQQEQQQQQQQQQQQRRRQRWWSFTESEEGEVEEEQIRGEQEQHENPGMAVDSEDPDGDPDGDPDIDDVHDDEESDYHSILNSLSRKWMSTELDHTISKVASNELWQLSFRLIPKLLAAKELQRIKRKVPQFSQIRKTIEKKNTPEVQLELGYRDKNTEEITIVHDTVTPRSRFPPHQYENLYEIATVKVIISYIHLQNIYYSY